MPTVDFLKSFADAWNLHDIEAIMDYMADDCVFVASSGTRFEGRDAVREVFAEVLADFPDVHFRSDQHFVSGDRGLSEWVFTGTDAEDGSKVEQQGCDIFTFRDGKIVP